MISGNYEGGFYYDLQRKNKLMSVSLHPNQIKNKDGKFVDVPDSEADRPDSIKEGEKLYRKKPIAIAILNEDFNISAVNEWTNFDGGDVIGGLFNSIKPFAAYTDYINKNLDIAIAQAEEVEQDTIKSSVATFLKKGVEFIKPWVEKGDDYLNRNLVVQGTRFVYYSGTGLSFSNLGMKYTIFPEWENGRFISVHEQLNEIFPYSIGEYVRFDYEYGDSTGNDTAESAQKSGSSGLFDLDWNMFLGWQLPPGGFRANVKSIDTVQRGTLKLKFGSYYCLDNLVISSISLNCSRQMVKNPTKPGELSPLFCEVMLALQPATKYSDVALKNFIEGRSMSKDRQEATNKLNSSLNSVKRGLTQLTEKYMPEEINPATTQAAKVTEEKKALAETSTARQRSEISSLVSNPGSASTVLGTDGEGLNDILGKINPYR